MKLYSIAFIKRYTEHYIDLKLEETIDDDGLKNDKDLNFKNNEQNQFNEIKIIKIYMLKIINYKGYNPYQFPFAEKNMEFLKEFIDNYKKGENNNNNNALNNAIVFNIKQNHLDINFSKQIKEAQNDEKMIDNLMDNYYSLLANQYLYKYLIEKKEYKNDDENYMNLINIWQSIKESNLNISQELITFFDNLLSIEFFIQLKSKIFDSKGNQKINSDLNEEKVIMILFIFKFVFLSIKNKKINIYKSLLKKQEVQKIIKESFLPGMPLTKKSNYLEQFKDIEIHLKTKKTTDAAYVCSCGTFYNVAPCGFPTVISKCPFCKKEIGGENHILFRREGHMRIFLNDEARKAQLGLSYADKKMPNMLLDEYKKYIEEKDKQFDIDKEQNLILVNKEEFLNPNIKVRNIDQLCFRVLNFILYSHIFYSYMKGILTNIEVDKFKISEMSIFNILEQDWSIIKEIIKDYRHIKDIKEFMNILFYIIESHQEEEKFHNKEERNIYEKKINDLINNCFINRGSDIFKQFKSNYEQNIKYLQLDKKSLNKVINQEYSPIEEEYKNNPLFKELQFFMLSFCPNKNLLESKFNNIIDGYKKYPIINFILNHNQQLEYIQNIPTLNKVTNMFKNHYSYNIERKEAQEKKIFSEKQALIDNLFNSDEKKFITLMQEYTRSWNEIKNIATKFDCKEEMPVHEIKNYEEEKIAYFLVDKSDFGYGMYLASAYQYLIEIQNNFIEGIINFSKENGDDSVHKNYINQLSKKINIQDADKKDIQKRITEEKLIDIINSSSIRKCFTEEGKIIYNNYEGIHIDLNLVEKLLCETVLSQVKNFKSDINYVTYRFEGYTHNSDTLIKYLEKYNPQRKLSDEENNIIINYIEKNKDINYKEFLFDIQKLINYIQEENFINEYSIYDIIIKMPSIIHLGEISQFIKVNTKLITVNTLIDFYNIFEHLCWEEIKKHINKEYEKKLTEQEKLNVNKYFENLSKECIINKLNLSTALRRYISRYLSGLIQEIIIKEEEDLMEQLKRPELWDYSFVDHPYFEKEIENIKKCLNIKVGQALDLYYILGGDDSIKPKFNISNKKINNVNIKDDQKDEAKNDYDEDNQKSNKEKKKGKKGKKEKEKQD